MKTKLLFLVVAGSVLALAAWQAQTRTPTLANKVADKDGEVVYQGLDFLIKNQRADGHWEDEGGHHAATTALAGLALVMERKLKFEDDRPITHDKKYAASIRKAVDWLMARSRAGRDGLIFSEHPSETAGYMQGHGLATVFLAGAYRQEPREDLAEVLTRAVKYTARAQSSQGGWYHTSRVEGHDFADVSETAVQIQALQAAENAAIPVPAEVLGAAQEYLKKALGEPGEKAGAARDRSRLADDAAGLVNCLFPDNRYRGMRDEQGEKWLQYCQSAVPMRRDIQFGRDELTHYYYAQALRSQDGKTWTDYHTAMVEHLKSCQNEDGSWPVAEGSSIGRVSATALWCVVLQVGNGNHPSTQREFAVK
jgi:hypothetical protein